MEAGADDACRMARRLQQISRPLVANLLNGSQSAFIAYMDTATDAGINDALKHCLFLAAERGVALSISLPKAPSNCSSLLHKVPYRALTYF